jgi:hypothetical protein
MREAKLDSRHAISSLADINQQQIEIHQATREALGVRSAMRANTREAGTRHHVCGPGTRFAGDEVVSRPCAAALVAAAR